MLQKKYDFIILFLLILSSLSWGKVLAQETEVELNRRYTPTMPTENWSFDYPSDWTLTDFNLDNDSTEDDMFVSLALIDESNNPSTTIITMEFYTQRESLSVLQLAGGNLESSIQLFLSYIGVIVPQTNPPTPLQTSVIFDGQSRIGTFILEGENGQYIFLAQGSQMADSEYIFVRITGATSALLNPDNADVMAAILRSLEGERDSTTDSTSQNTTTASNPPGVVEVSVVPCMVQGIRNDDGTIRPTEARVGPGTNRGVIGSITINGDTPVIGTNVTSNGSIWWRLDKSEVAPQSSANQIWVADSLVTTSGDCDEVGTTSAPPIVRAPQVPNDPQASTGSTAPPVVQPEPPAGSTVEFYADIYSLYYEECTTLYWNVSNVTGVTFEGQPVAFQNNIRICPEFTSIYTLRVILNSGDTQDYTITIEVIEEDLVFCVIPDSIPFEAYGLTISDEVQTWEIYVDPCQTPMTIWIEMFSPDVDPVIDVSVDGFYVGSDDDSGGGLNAYLEIFLPEGTTIVTIFAQNISGTTGTYDLLVDILP